MQTFLRAVQVVGLAMLVGIAQPVWAESAPVYDADSLPQQFEGESDPGQDLPPPPPPGQEGTFVPTQNQLPVAPSSPPPSSLSVEQRMKRVEQQVNNMQTNDATSRVDSLQSQVQSLRAQVEQLTHQLQQLQTQLKGMYNDLDRRLANGATAQTKPVEPEVAPATVASNEPPQAVGVGAKAAARKTKVVKAADSAASPLEAAATSASADTGAAKAADGQPNVAEEQQIYQTAYNLIKAKKYDEAVEALQGMLKKYPSGQFASNAHYWLGELYGLMGKNDQALIEFGTVVKSYPESPRVSDAQLKVGLIYAADSKWSEAKASFKKVINRYPGTASARLASEQLKELKQAGH